MSNIVFDNPRIVHGDQIIVIGFNGNSYVGIAYYSPTFTEKCKVDGNVTYRSDYFKFPYHEDDCHATNISNTFINKVVIDEQYEALYE